RRRAGRPAPRPQAQAQRAGSRTRAPPRARRRRARVSSVDMKPPSSFRRTALTGAALLFIACGGVTSLPTGSGGVTSGAGGAGGGSSTGTDGSGAYAACSTANDCAWGEIDHEILTSADCPCLFGCPYIPLSKSTVDRRQAQYNALCTPGVDGMGNGCGVDDCAGPPTAICNAGTCMAAPTP